MGDLGRGRGGPPRVEDVELLAGDRARLVVADGRGVIGVDYDPPPPGSSWPRWDRSVLVAGERLYGVGSDCGTCETSLRLIGWPRRPAAALSQRVRDRLGDVGALSGDVLDAVAPLLTGLRSGHYLGVLADLELEHVTDAEGSWCSRRYDLRADTEEDGLDWPGTEHLQVRTVVRGGPPSPGPASRRGCCCCAGSRTPGGRPRTARRSSTRCSPGCGRSDPRSPAGLVTGT